VPKTPRKWWRTIAEAFAVFVVVLLGLEMMFAFAGIGEGEVLQIDRASGYVPIPGKHITWRTEGFARNQLNSFGMNDIDRPFAKPPGTMRIAVMGDSLVHALEVDRKQNFCSKLADNLNHDGRKVEVLNFGVQAYNLGQMYIRMRDVAMKFHPDVVILPVRVDSAYILPPGPGGGFIFARPTFFAQNGKLIEYRDVQKMWLGSPEGKRMRATAWLRNNSHIYGVIHDCAARIILWYQKSQKAAGDLYQKLTAKPTAGGTQSKSAKPAVDPDAVVINKLPTAGQDGCTQYWWPVADALIAEMNAQCKAANCKLVIVRLASARGQQNPLESRLLRETATKWSVPEVDLTDDFLNAPNRDGLFYWNHMTPAGHTLAAEKVYEFLSRVVFIPLNGKS
jgi:hypothetical protein